MRDDVSICKHVILSYIRAVDSISACEMVFSNTSLGCWYTLCDTASSEGLLTLLIASERLSGLCRTGPKRRRGSKSSKSSPRYVLQIKNVIWLIAHRCELLDTQPGIIDTKSQPQESRIRQYKEVVRVIVVSCLLNMQGKRAKFKNIQVQINPLQRANTWFRIIFDQPREHCEQCFGFIDRHKTMAVLEQFLAVTSRWLDFVADRSSFFSNHIHSSHV